MLVPMPTNSVEAKSVSHRHELSEAATDEGDGGEGLQNIPAESTAPQLDTGRYCLHLAYYQLTDAQADEFLETLWNIVLACIDLKVNVDLEAVLSGSWPLENAMLTTPVRAELCASTNQNGLIIGEAQPTERCRRGR